MDCQKKGPCPGVQLTEQRYRDDDSRERIIQKLTSTPGTFTYTAPVVVDKASPPTELKKALAKANEAEAKL